MKLQYMVGKSAIWLVLALAMVAAFALLPAGIVCAGPQVNTSLSEVILPDGIDGLLKQTWVGIPGDGGEIVLPVPKVKATIVSVSLTGGTLKSAEPVTVSVNNKKAYSWKAEAEEGKKVTLTVTYKVAKMFAPPETAAASDSEGGPTQRGDLRKFEYTFENVLPYGIQDYSVSVSLPASFEIFAVESPAKYTLGLKDGVPVISVSLKGKEGAFGLAQGGSSTVRFTYLQARKGVAFVWFAAIVIAGLSLIRNRSTAGIGGKRVAKEA